ncbi:hypothetical protein MLD38_013028 [Melastoma candidum]|uniref:Uncharacterized protein n=1 Tax=Melastoma candidum TaxID=119954 RepID=A0ACB9R8C3_9MYRT|nr:hypothetical protein MLD38_013028 [Melastoma candidum]
MAQFSALSREIESLGQVHKLVEAFRAFDSDDDGWITAAELGGILRSLGCNVSDHDVGAMMPQGNAGRHRLLSMDEFLEMNTKDMGLGSGLGSVLDATIEVFGPNSQDVTITGEELHEVMENLGVNGLSVEECTAIVASMDGDGDGAVTIEDLRLIVECLL